MGAWIMGPRIGLYDKTEEEQQKAEDLASQNVDA